MEINMDLDAGRMRSATFCEGRLSILEIGQNAYIGSEKGLVSWETIKIARLADLQVSSQHLKLPLLKSMLQNSPFLCNGL